MRKLITLLAATTLVASSFALAEANPAPGNPNDVLQTVPGQNDNASQNLTVASADNSAPAAEQAANDDAKPVVVKKKHHRKNHGKKHHRAAHKMKDEGATTQPAATETPVQAPAEAQ
jgi:hypothetical protein